MALVSLLTYVVHFHPWTANIWAFRPVMTSILNPKILRHRSKIHSMTGVTMIEGPYTTNFFLGQRVETPDLRLSGFSRSVCWGCSKVSAQSTAAIIRIYLRKRKPRRLFPVGLVRQKWQPYETWMRRPEDRLLQTEITIQNGRTLTLIDENTSSGSDWTTWGIKM
jgi:hypothetical protein